MVQAVILTGQVEGGLRRLCGDGEKSDVHKVLK